MIEDDLPTTQPSTVHPHSSALPDLPWPFTITRHIGHGGMGDVYEAWDQHLKRQVAVKLVRAEGGPDALTRFALEMEVQARFATPHVVHIYQSGITAAGLPFAVMEHFPSSLQQRLQSQTPVHLIDVLLVTRDVADGLRELHDNSLIHRDVKPQNILLRDSGRAALSDLGITRPLVIPDPALTGPGFRLGTPDYMSPEQALGRPLTTATDVYSLALVFYQLLTGTLPFADLDPAARFVARQTAAFPELGSSSIPSQVHPLLRKMTSPAPDDRPAARAVVNSIDSLVPSCLLGATHPEMCHYFMRLTPTERERCYTSAKDRFQQNYIEDRHYLTSLLPFFSFASDSALDFAAISKHERLSRYAYCLSNLPEPRWQEALPLLDEAIRHSADECRSIYRFNRAVCRLYSDPAFQQGAASAPELASIVLDDLIANKPAKLADRIDGSNFRRGILEWMRRNDMDARAHYRDVPELKPWRTSVLAGRPYLTLLPDERTRLIDEIAEVTIETPVDAWRADVAGDQLSFLLAVEPNPTVRSHGEVTLAALVELSNWWGAQLNQDNP